MSSLFAKLARRGLLGALPFQLACNCPLQAVVRAPESVAGTTISPKPSIDECRQLCGPSVRKCERAPIMDAAPTTYAAPPTTGFTVVCTLPKPCGAGRRPAGLDDGRAIDATAGAYFAEVARLEAASVHAFRELARELELHGAPPRLIEAAHRAAAEEITHARLVADLAGRFGAPAIGPAVTPTPPRDLAGILVDNAVEGLVRERYGAALAAVQARRSHVPAVRRAMTTIARDEAGHAELSAALHQWGLPRVSRAARARIASARDHALDELRDAVDVEPSPELAVAAGLPSATLAHDVLAAVA